MSSSCIEEVTIRDDNWFRIVSEMLGRAGIAINGTAASDIQIKHPDFFKRVMQEGSLGLGESYMDGWWECERLDLFFTQVLRAGLENQLPSHLKDTLRIATARLLNLQSKKRACRKAQRQTCPAGRRGIPDLFPDTALRWFQRKGHTMFDVLMYLFETYIHNEAETRVDQDRLTRDLTDAG
jgi:hypothetical protein